MGISLFPLRHVLPVFHGTHEEGVYHLLCHFSCLLDNSVDMKGNALTDPFYYIHIWVPLIIGLFIYLSFGRETYIASLILRHFPWKELPAACFPSASVSFIRNSMCDILWAYALTFSVFLVMAPDLHLVPMTPVICIGFSALLEGLQLADSFPGTFDPLDIVLETITIVIAYSIIKKHEVKQNEKDSEDY